MKSKRILVVGASSGIGAAFATAAAEAGAAVAVSARREDKLQSLVATVGSGLAVAGDASSAEDAERIVSEAAEFLGGLDLVLYAAGFGILQPVSEIDPDKWSEIYAVNVLGANMIAGHAVKHMSRDGVIAFVSSRTVDDNNAYFSSYSASKAAMDQCIETWRVERPQRRFVRVQMGNCVPTEFANHMGDDLIGPALDTWMKQGIPGGFMQVEEVGRAMVRALSVSLDFPEIDMPELKMDARVDVGADIADLNPLD